MVGCVGGGGAYGEGALFGAADVGGGAELGGEFSAWAGAGGHVSLESGGGDGVCGVGDGVGGGERDGSAEHSVPDWGGEA